MEVPARNYRHPADPNTSDAATASNCGSTPSEHPADPASQASTNCGREYCDHGGELGGAAEADGETFQVGALRGVLWAGAGPGSADGGEGQVERLGVEGDEGQPADK